MRGCTLLWHPSLVEACPMSVAEAMAQHTPVLASREAHGSSWLLDHGAAGHLVPGRNMEAMARGLEHMLSNPLERAKLARVAFDRARELFAPDRVLGAYHAVYENRLGYTGRGP